MTEVAVKRIESWMKRFENIKYRTGRKILQKKCAQARQTDQIKVPTSGFFGFKITQLYLQIAILG